MVEQIYGEITPVPKFFYLYLYDLFQCDGYSLDLHSGPSLEGIALLNIPSIYGGTNLWGDNPSQKKRRKAQKQMKKDKDKELSTSSMSSIELGIAVQGKLTGFALEFRVLEFRGLS